MSQIPRFLFAVLAACALAACVSTPASAQATSPIVGRLYHYLRSNQDGSLPEQVYVYRASASQVEVGKMVEPCTNAAFVTGELDLARRQPLALTGGRLNRDGSQNAFAWLSYDPAARRLHARVPMANVDQDVAVDGEPWTIYDFDLSDITALNAGHAPARADFDIAVALILPVEGTDPFRNLGVAHFRYAAVEQRLNRQAVRFDVSGGLNGQLWLDADEGHVVEAQFAEPNHVEYDNFHLVLQGIEDDAAASWAAVRAAHWADCP